MHSFVLLSLIVTSTLLHAADKDDFFYYSWTFYVMSMATNETFVTSRSPDEKRSEHKPLFEITNTDKRPFKYCWPSKSLSQLSCSLGISGPPTVIYRRSYKPTKDVKGAMDYYRSHIAPIQKMDATFVCDFGCNKEIPPVVFMVLQDDES